jgi:hypothetical protein
MTSALFEPRCVRIAKWSTENSKESPKDQNSPDRPIPRASGQDLVMFLLTNHLIFAAVMLYHLTNVVNAASSSIPSSGNQTSTVSSFTRTTILPTSTPTATATILDLSHQQANTTFSLPLIQGPPLPLTIGCKLCQTAGHLLVNQTAFHIDISNPISAKNSTPLQYIQGGEVQLQLSNFSAYVELDITPSLSGGTSLTLFSVPIFGFAVSTPYHAL